MSTEEILPKYYHGSYKSSMFGNYRKIASVNVSYLFSDCRGGVVCPLYDETNQTCQFYVEIQGDSLNPAEFETFWSHVRTNHEDTYVEILEMCRSKASDMSTMNQVNCLLRKDCVEDSRIAQMKINCSLINTSLSVQRSVECRTFSFLLTPLTLRNIFPF